MDKKNQNKNETLSGIERELVLQYLMDGNVPVTLTPINEDKNNDSDDIHAVASQIFPVALKPEHIHVQKNGKIHLENPPQSVIGFKNKRIHQIKNKIFKKIEPKY